MPDDGNSRLDKANDWDRPASFPAVETSPPAPDFDEDTYLRAFPDVAAAVQVGTLASGAYHYQLCGRAEGRLLMSAYLNQGLQGEHLAAEPASSPANPAAPLFGIDVVIASGSGALLVVGWTDDRRNPLIAISVQLPRCSPYSWTRFPRLRRSDVETVVHSSTHYHYGFWVFREGAMVSLRRETPQPTGECIVDLQFADGTAATVSRPLLHEGDMQLRDTVMGYLSAAEYHGNRSVEACLNLDAGAGDALTGLSRSLSRAISAQAAVERFGPDRRHFTGSIIVPLYGISDFFFTQSCLFAQSKDIREYEFIYVINSPELIEKLLREARIAEMTYGLSQVLVMLPGNAGFGTANNIAARIARSDRLLCVNPDVFPREQDWAQRHTDLLACAPAEQTRIFGTSLYYDDGSLMHGGMYFEIDSGVHITPDGITRRALLRVEHYGKGGPSWATQFTTARKVPAVTGAFISIARDWYEKLGGFTEDYIFGHYEDADLCLKSLAGGIPVWMHDIPMWHLEGKGSKRLPAHDGGALLNRWLFSRTWQSLIVPDLIGKTPLHPLLREAGDRPAEAVRVARKSRRLSETPGSLAGVR